MLDVAAVFPSSLHHRHFILPSMIMRISFAISCCLEIRLSRRFQVGYDPVLNVGCGGTILYSRATTSLIELRF